jgi:zinc transport system ATP-binding protein
MQANHTLEVFWEGKLIFYSASKWLYPIFELEEFLAAADYEPGQLVVTDKIVGRASALLLIRLGIGRVVAGIMSQLGKEALERHHVKYEYETFVGRITCQTEEMLVDEYDPQRAYVMLKERAGG